MNNIKLITLKTNQTLLSETDCISDEVVVLKKPVQLFVQQTKEGPMMAFTPFLDYAEEFQTGIKISMNDILTINNPNTELVNHYNKVFGSGIQIASHIPKM